ncbi:MAG: TlpA disulfide reductase family protein [Bdellovibrionales bacterium]|nr:TlpA disulfide reductase family protein [Bdellovibrionales bacterium]
MMHHRFAKPVAIIVGLLGLIAAISFFLFIPKMKSDAILLNDLLQEPLLTVDGRKIDLSDSSSSKYPVVIVNFWASWCPPCAEELPSLLKLVRKFEGKVLILAISEDEDVEKMNSFLKQYGELPNSFAVIWDKGFLYKARFRAEKLPESWIFDKDRRLDKKINGYEDWGTPGALQYFKELVER